MKPTRLNKFALALALIWTPATVNADDALLDLSLEQLLQIDVDTSASKFAQKISEAPSAVGKLLRLLLLQDVLMLFPAQAFD